MELPAFTSDNLQYVAKAATDDALYDMFVGNPVNLIAFVEIAADDETWSEKHYAFMTKALDWLTTQTYNDKLFLTFVRRIAQAVRKHYTVLKSALPHNILVKLQDAEIPSNSILLAGASDYFRQQMLKECRDKKGTILTLGNMSSQEFAPINAFITTGESTNLLTMGPDDVRNIIEIILF